MSNSTSTPAKAKTTSELWWHKGAKQWAKKHRGRFYYFGADKDDALKRYRREWDYIITGRTPPPDDADYVSIADLCNKFLGAKKSRYEAGELTARSWREYYRTCERLVTYFGKGRNIADIRPLDFADLRAQLAERYAPVTLASEIGRIRVVLNYAWENGLIDRPIRYGSELKKPSKRTLRAARAKRPPKLFSREDILALLDVAGVPLRAMILLGINGGLGAADIGRFERRHLDLGSGWVTYPRGKTGIGRRFPLWPETIEAIREAIARRPKDRRPETANLVFLTKYGNPWWKENIPDDIEKSTESDAVRQRFDVARRKTKLNRPGLGFYTLRHTFETIASESKDQIAVDAIMGHVDDSMAAHYRERISDDRLRAVVDVVHTWLLGEGGE